MQDIRSGIMHSIPPEYLKLAGEEIKKLKDQIHLEEAIRQQMAEKIPREYQGPILCVGEVVDIKGGKFQIIELGETKIVLSGEPQP